MWPRLFSELLQYGEGVSGRRISSYLNFLHNNLHCPLDISLPDFFPSVLDSTSRSRITLGGIYSAIVTFLLDNVEPAIDPGRFLMRAVDLNLPDLVVSLLEMNPSDTGEFEQHYHVLSVAPLDREVLFPSRPLCPFYFIQ